MHIFSEIQDEVLLPRKQIGLGDEASPSNRKLVAASKAGKARQAVSVRLCGVRAFSD